MPTRLLVKSPTGSVYDIEVEDYRYATIASVKYRLADLLNVETKAIRLIFCGRELNDDHKTVADYHVETQSYIHMVLHNPPPTATSSSSLSFDARSATGEAVQRLETELQTKLKEVGLLQQQLLHAR